MKKSTKTLFLLYVMVLAFLIPITVTAQETTLTTTVPSSHILHLDIEGKGTVAVNGIEHSKSKDIFIQRHSEPSIQIQASRGYSVRSVTYNQENITHLFNSGKWTMPKVESDVVLTVVFTRDGSSPPIDDVNHFYYSFVKYILSWIHRFWV